jgi:predicted amidohydrolase YtcJ
MRTINSAFVMRQEDRTGSLKENYDADFIIIDRDIFVLSNTNDYAGIAGTKVLSTVLEGQEVYKDDGRIPSCPK